MIQCLCNQLICKNKLCHSSYGCYKTYITEKRKSKLGCLEKSIKESWKCDKSQYCCDTNLCNNHTVMSISRNDDTNSSDDFYLFLSLKVVLPICLALLLLLCVFIYFIRKYQYNLTRYLKICSGYSMSNNLSAFSKTVPEDCQSRFVDNSSNLMPMITPDNERITDKKCDSFTSGSGSGMPFLVQRTIARQVQLLSIIGKGRFGEVWKGDYYGEMVAVKIFASRDEISWQRETFIYNTFLLRHPNILSYYASDVVSMHGCTQLWLVTQYHESGSLYDYLHSNVLSYRECLQLMSSIAAGLCHLHTEINSGSPPNQYGKPAIAHRDLKSKNILVVRKGEACIADLGLSVIQNDSANVSGVSQLASPGNTAVFSSTIISVSKHKVGTRRYMAPEILSDCRCSDLDPPPSPPLPTNHILPSSTQHSTANDMQQTNPPLSVTSSSCPIRFSHFLSADIFAFSLIQWELLSRTDISDTNHFGSTNTSSHNSASIPEYRVPFHDKLPPDPTTAQMRQLICIDRTRPNLTPSINVHHNRYYEELVQLMQECWAHNCYSRPSALRLKKTLLSILNRFSLMLINHPDDSSSASSASLIVNLHAPFANLSVSSTPANFSYYPNSSYSPTYNAPIFRNNASN